MKETLKKAGYVHEKYIGDGQHCLRNQHTGLLELWTANKNHASYGIKYKNTHLEFCSTISIPINIH